MLRVLVVADLAGSLLGAGCLASPGRLHAAEPQGDRVRPVRAEKLPNVPGQSLTAVIVDYPPGGRSPAHHHAGSIFVFVLAGESFFEPSGSEHLVSENASATEPARLLAIFVAEDGAELTHFDR